MKNYKCGAQETDETRDGGDGTDWGGKYSNKLRRDDDDECTRQKQNCAAPRDGDNERERH